MVALVKFTGIIIAGLGLLFLLSPKILKKYIAFWVQGKRLYAGGALSFLFGILFLLAASQCTLRGVIAAIGIISLIKGIALSIRGLEKTKSMLLWWDERSLMAIRLVAVLDIAIGVLIIYSA